jgi:hypothetical protein
MIYIQKYGNKRLSPFILTIESGTDIEIGDLALFCLITDILSNSNLEKLDLKIASIIIIIIYYLFVMSVNINKSIHVK